MNYDFKEGDKVEVVRVEFTTSEWNNVGKVPVSFKIGDILTIKQIDINIAKPLKFLEHNKFFPKEGFIPYVEPIVITKDKDYKYLIPIIEKLNKDYV